MMNEETKQFERRLSHQPLRQIPAGWHAGILAAAGRASSIERRGQERHWLSTLNSQLSNVFWPHPKAWAGLAAIWVFIFIVNFSIRDKMPVVAEKSAPPSPEIIVELKQQQRMLAELIGSSQAREADLPKFFPLPRSEHVEILMT